MLTIQGVFLGSRSIPYGSEGKIRIEIGLLTKRSNSFGAIVESTDIIRVPAARAGEVASWEKFKNQQVSIPVFVQAFSTRSGVGFGYYIQNGYSPVLVSADVGSDVFGGKK